MFFTLPMMIKLTLFVLFAICIVQIIMTVVFWSFMSKVLRVIKRETPSTKDEAHMTKMARLISSKKKDTIEVYGTDERDDTNEYRNI